MILGSEILISMDSKSFMHRCIIGFIINHITMRVIVRKTLNFVNRDD